MVFTHTAVVSYSTRGSISFTGTHGVMSELLLNYVSSNLKGLFCCLCGVAFFFFKNMKGQFLISLCTLDSMQGVID